MDYRETPLPPPLAGLVKARWTLAADGAADEWLPQQATPDGCIEVIRRTRGRSRWGCAQSASFVVGLVDRPQPFEISVAVTLYRARQTLRERMSPKEGRS